MTHKDGSTCGVSNEHFYKETEEIERTFNIRRERFSRVIFTLRSWPSHFLISLQKYSKSMVNFFDKNGENREK